MEHISKSKTIKSCHKDFKNSLIVPTPSSPREFFARIYGHLESDNSKTTAKDDKASTQITDCNEYSDSNCSVSSSSEIDVNDHSEDISEERRQWSKSVISQASSNDGALIRIPTDIDQPGHLMPGMPGHPYWFPALPFHAGLSAFLSRRRRAGARPRRQRTTFSAAQTLRLEVEFRRAEYVARARRLELASTLRLSETQVKIWFQNRRAKDKRIEKAQLDQHYRQLAATSGLVPNYYPRHCAICLYRGDATLCPHQVPSPSIIPSVVPGAGASPIIGVQMHTDSTTISNNERNRNDENNIVFQKQIQS